MLHYQEAYLGLPDASMLVLFTKIVNCLYPLTVIPKSSMMYVPHDPEYTPLEGVLKNSNNLRRLRICHSIRFLIYSPNHLIQSRLQLQVQLQRSIFHLNMIQQCSMILLKQGMLMRLILLFLSQTDLDVSHVLSTFSRVNYIFKKI